jgi:hypothetical protein
MFAKGLAIWCEGEDSRVLKQPREAVADYSMFLAMTTLVRMAVRLLHAFVEKSAISKVRLCAFCQKSAIVLAERRPHHHSTWMATPVPIPNTAVKHQGRW